MASGSNDWICDIDDPDHHMYEYYGVTMQIPIYGTGSFSDVKSMNMDDLPTTGDETGRAFRDIAWENHILEMTRNLGIGVSILCFALYHHHQYLTLTFLRLNLEVNILYTTSA